MKYVSTFITGFSDVITTQLQSELKDFIPLTVLDGIIIYWSTSLPNEIRELKFVNNSFVLLEQYKSNSMNQDMIDLINNILNKESVGQEVVEPINKTFRLVFSNQNEMVHIPPSLQNKLEAKLSMQYKLKLDRNNPDTEFWFMTRSEGQSLLARRITKHPDYKDILSKGQLRPELAHLLCILSDPCNQDVFLDPFAGSGAIAEQRKLWPAKEIISSDLKQGEDVFETLKKFSGKINKVVTDPPWGIEVGKELDIELFYKKLFTALSMSLMKNGLVVMLTAQKGIVEQLVSEPEWRLISRWDILVSGKKAGVFKFCKHTTD